MQGGQAGVDLRHGLHHCFVHVLKTLGDLPGCVDAQKAERLPDRGRIGAASRPAFALVSPSIRVAVLRPTLTLPPHPREVAVAQREPRSDVDGAVDLRRRLLSAFSSAYSCDR